MERPSPVAAAITALLPAPATSEGHADTPAELGGAFIGGLDEGSGDATLPPDVVRALTQALASSLAAAHDAVAVGSAAEAQTRLLDALPQPPQAATTPAALAQVPAWASVASVANAAAQLSAEATAQVPFTGQEALNLDRNAHLVLQIPQPATPAVGVVVVPQLLSALHAGTVQQHALRVRRDRERRHALPAFEPEEQDDDADGGAAAAAAAPADDAAAALPPSVRRFRALWPLLQGAPPPGAAAELAQRRRVLLVTPSASAHAEPSALDAYLLGTDAQGVGRAARYRARGARGARGAQAARSASGAPSARDAGVQTEGGHDLRKGEGEGAALAWQHWRVHRDFSAGSAPRLVASRSPAPLAAAPDGGGAAPTLLLRLTPTPQPPPLRDAHTAWLDLLDTRRFLHDLGSQWSLLVLWSAHAVAAEPAAADAASAP